MKQRLLVMNGQRIVQTEQDGVWGNHKVDKAGTLKPGIYNLHLALQSDKAKRYEGVTLHSDEAFVYQKAGNIFKHDRPDFDKVPNVGSLVAISYLANGRAHVEPFVPQLAHKHSRQF